MGPLEPVSAMRPEVPGGFDQAIAKALSRNRSTVIRVHGLTAARGQMRYSEISRRAGSRFIAG